MTLYIQMIMNFGGEWLSITSIVNKVRDIGGINSYIVDTLILNNRNKERRVINNVL